MFIEKTIDMLDFLIPHYMEEGKTQLVIGIGCTGGRHRSVVISEKIGSMLKEKQYRAFVLHRDIGKNKENYNNEI